MDKPSLRSQAMKYCYDDLYKDELIDLQCQTKLYSKLMSCNGGFSKFWWGLGEELPTISKRAYEVIVPIQITYMYNCDHKTKHRSRLVPKDYMIVVPALPLGKLSGCRGRWPKGTPKKTKNTTG